MLNTFVKYIFLVLFINSYANSMENFFWQTSPSTAHIVFKEGVCGYNGSSQLSSLDEVQASFEKDKQSVVKLVVFPDCQTNVDNLYRFLSGVAHKPDQYGNPNTLSLITGEGNADYRDKHLLLLPPIIHMNIIDSITSLVYLEVLTFQGLVVNFSDPSWSSLINLKQLTLTSISFFGENILDLSSKRLNKYESYDDLNFKKFAIGLSSFPKLEVLDLSDNEFFPHPLCKIKNKPTKAQKDYDNWCESHVGECAELLGLNFKGHTLKMSNNNLGPNFLKGFSGSLENNRKLKEIDLSRNSFKADEASDFIVFIHKTRRLYDIKIHIHDNLFKEGELNAQLVEKLLDNVNLQQ